MLFVACKNKDTEDNIVCQEQYYELIENKTNEIWSDEGFSCSYYYNLDSQYELIFELILYKDNIEVDKVEIKDIKNNIGSIDGTFGVSVDRDKENNIITWTLRHDEDIKHFTSVDFFKDIMGTIGGVSQSGIIVLGGNAAISNKYDVDKNNNENSNKQYEWKVELNIYGHKINKEICN